MKNLINTISLLILLISPTIVCSQSLTAKEQLEIPEGKVGLVGYGSLTSKESMEKSLGITYVGLFKIVHIEGYFREWNYARANNGINKPLLQYIENKDTITPKLQIALNIRESSYDTINGALFIIDKSDLIKFDLREQGYERIDVSNKIREFEITNGLVYIYKALPNNTVTLSNNSNENIIPKQYIDVINQAFETLGNQFESEFTKSTGLYPINIVKETIKKQN